MATGVPGRAYTTYDVYRDYGAEELMEDMYPLEGRSHTPRLDGRFTSYNGRTSPRHCPSPERPRSKIRSPGRPASRMNMGVKTETRRNFAANAPAETQRNYVIPDQIMRPTSPVQRLLDRSNTQPFMSMQPATTPDMDPITRQYYYRNWSPKAEVMLSRQGRAGGLWRHIRACQAQSGTQLAFIDGTVKQEDNIFFPQYTMKESNSVAQSVPTYAMYPMSSRAPVRQSSGSSKGLFRNKFHDHAKDGFKYWYQEQKPIDLRGPTTRLKARLVGSGY